MMVYCTKQSYTYNVNSHCQYEIKLVMGLHKIFSILFALCVWLQVIKRWGISMAPVVYFIILYTMAFILPMVRLY